MCDIVGSHSKALQAELIVYIPLNSNPTNMLNGFCLMPFNFEHEHYQQELWHADESENKSYAKHETNASR